MKRRTSRVHLIGARNVICDKMLTFITKGWDHFIVLRDEEVLVNKVQNDIRILWEQPGYVANHSERAIEFLFLRSWNELQQLKVSDRTKIIMGGYHVLSMRQMIQLVQGHCNLINDASNPLRAKF